MNTITQPVPPVPPVSIGSDAEDQKVIDQMAPTNALLNLLLSAYPKGVFPKNAGVDHAAGQLVFDYRHLAAALEDIRNVLACVDPRDDVQVLLSRIRAMVADAQQFMPAN